jgi:hypothetical protein
MSRSLTVCSTLIAERLSSTGRILLTAIFILSLSACSGYRVENFKPVVNIKLPADKSFEVDMDSVIVAGMQAPTLRQVKDGLFRFTFEVKQKDDGERLFYKIFYQNEQYKIPELREGRYDSLCLENFYGSWGEEDLGFKPVPSGSSSISDGFRIVGNPRNERKFFGLPMDEYQVSEDAVRRQMEVIRDVSDWYASVREKAEVNKMPVQQQLRLDAIYALCYSRDRGSVNHRWKRNPRMGRYSAMLVVCTESDLEKIPEYIRDISLTRDGKYVNPYHYFLYGEGAHLPGTQVLLDSNFVRLKSRVQVGKGVFINKAEQQNEQEYTYLNSSCNNTADMFRTAHIEQFFHAEIRDYHLNTIPVIADLPNDGYTRSDFEAGEKRWAEEEMIKDYIRSSNCPCKTVKVSEDGTVDIFNPKSTDLGRARKENVGIKTRIGYTYGTFTAKVKFPSQLNSTNVWNGLTNAFWMLYQDKQGWNNRRDSKTGYAQKGVYSPDAPRSTTTYYSEIDFEMVKTSRYWPAGYYEDSLKHIEDGRSNHDVIVTTTNFDLACKDPVRFSGKFAPTSHDGLDFEPFRWEPWHQALTIRTPVPNDELYNPDYFLYQIEWKPTEIIWRIGPSKDRMRVVGYMNDEVTMIPNNQMVMLVTQEYHRTDWWPPMPFPQEYVPFLKEDLHGKIFDFEVE